MENKISKFIGSLFHSRTQAHIYHLQTDSFAVHMALGGYYEGIVPLIDSLVESYQSSNNIVRNYSSTTFKDFVGTEAIIYYFNNLLKDIESNREEFKGTDLQNIIDEIVSLIKGTLYKLKHLK